MNINEMLAVTFAAVDQPMSDLAIKAMATDLSGYSIEAVAEALTRCRKELRRITLADIIARIPGEHPGPEVAWGIISKAMQNEKVSIAVTGPMMEAYGACSALAHDEVAARMCFKEAYLQFVSKARATGARPYWWPSLGFDQQGREDAANEAERLNVQASKNILISGPQQKRLN